VEAIGAKLRSALTLIICGAIVVALGMWGFGALFAPFPDFSSAGGGNNYCKVRQVKAGEALKPPDVVVSVFNAGKTSGLARDVAEAFTGVGFVEGETGNTSVQAVKTAEVWAKSSDDPAARLVASYLGADALKVTTEDLADGVVVVVGDDFEQLKKGKESLELRQDAGVCAPLNTNV
jgi:hypothetical protein